MASGYTYKPCSNVDICGDRECVVVREPHVCLECQQLGLLEILHQSCEEECPVCRKHMETKFKFPSCDHWACSHCLRLAFFGPDGPELADINPVLYGCPPCPNGCKNPNLGRQCGCKEYDVVKQKWSDRCPEECNAWMDDEQMYSENIGANLREEALGCPLCRTPVGDSV